MSSITSIRNRLNLAVLLLSFCPISYSTELVELNDWGTGFNASYRYEIQPEDTIAGVLSKWRIEVNHEDSVAINNAWMNGYNGTVGTTNSSDDTFIISTTDGFRPTLNTGDILNFTIQGNGSFSDANFLISFSSLDEGERLQTNASVQNVNDWFNPQYGGGFQVSFSCEIDPNTITEIEIDIDYTGSGTIINNWMSTWIGNTDSGNIADDNGYAIIARSPLPSNLPDSITFTLQVDGAGFEESDFTVSCFSGNNVVDDSDFVDPSEPLPEPLPVDLTIGGFFDDDEIEH